MNKQTQNKIKAGILMFLVDVVGTIITLYLLGFDGVIFTRQSLGIIALVNVMTTIVLSKFKLIEDGK